MNIIFTPFKDVFKLTIQLFKSFIELGSESINKVFTVILFILSILVSFLLLNLDKLETYHYGFFVLYGFVILVCRITDNYNSKNF